MNNYGQNRYAIYLNENAEHFFRNYSLFTINYSLKSDEFYVEQWQKRGKK